MVMQKHMTVMGEDVHRKVEKCVEEEQENEEQRGLLLILLGRWNWIRMDTRATMVKESESCGVEMHWLTICILDGFRLHVR